MNFPIRIEIPGREAGRYRTTPSVNQLERMHWSTRMEIDKTWVDELFFMLREPKRSALIRYIGKHRPKMKCRIVQRRKRLLDEDNFIGGLKPLIDGIKNNKYIVDDRPEFFTLEPKPIQEKAGKARELTIIELEPVG